MNREAINEWVEQRIAENKLSLRELGRQTGIDHSAISKVLNGKREASFDFYIKIARVFSAVPEMLQVAGVVSEKEKVEMSLWELFKLVRSLSPEEQKEVSDFVDFLAHRKQQDEANSKTS